MKAVYLTAHSGIEKLAYSELLGRVRTCRVNHADLWCRPGMSFLRPQLPFIPVDRGGSEGVSTRRIRVYRRRDLATIEC
jgi:NADPH:quinone reductase-like Zn-dependent oxidoreductase